MVTCYVPGTVLRALHIFSLYLFLEPFEGRCYYCPHSKETEALGRQLASLVSVQAMLGGLSQHHSRKGSGIPWGWREQRDSAWWQPVPATPGSVAVIRIYSTVKPELYTCIMFERKTIKRYQS